MNSNGPAPEASRSEISPRHGFTESHPENRLRDWILLGAAFTGTPVALILQDDSGVWHRDGSGLTEEQMAALEWALAQGSTEASRARLLKEQELLILEALPMMDLYQRNIGTLCALSTAPATLTARQKEGLRVAADQIEAFLTTDLHRMETRATPRAPSATSFVPGLVHELGSFIFGISANLDAFEARFADLEDVRKYGANIRRSLDRMNAFNEELRDYGDPGRFSWSIRELGPLLREAVDCHQAEAEKARVRLQLKVEAPLPAINMDEHCLQSSFSRLVDLALHQEEAGGQVVLHVGKGLYGERAVVCGHVDCSSLRFKNVDPARLFEPFYFRTSGLGRLTLPGARRVFESHGGTLTAGPGPSSGTMRISFMLPSAQASPAQPASKA